MTTSVRCFVVDDSALSRKIVRTAVEAVSGTEVVGIAHDGQDAVEQIRIHKPHFVTMDLEMPRMNGIDAVREIRRFSPDTKIVMVSSLTSAGAEITTRALQAGAFDFVLKPVGNNVDECIAILARQLSEKIDVVRDQLTFRFKMAARASAPSPQIPSSYARQVSRDIQAIAIGVSTGGPVALSNVLPLIPATFGAPIYIVQHMPPVFTKSLADQLNRESQIRVYEAEDGMRAEPGSAYIAPGGKQMKIESSVVSPIIRITDDAPESNARPSVDYMFRSASQLYQNKLLAVVLTGMGNDGTVGCREVKRRGGTVISQDAESSVVYGMPRSVAEAGLSDEVLPLNAVANTIVKLTREGASLCR